MTRVVITGRLMKSVVKIHEDEGGSTGVPVPTRSRSTAHGRGDPTDAGGGASVAHRGCGGRARQIGRRMPARHPDGARTCEPSTPATRRVGIEKPAYSTAWTIFDMRARRRRSRRVGDADAPVAPMPMATGACLRWAATVVIMIGESGRWPLCRIACSGVVCPAALGGRSRANHDRVLSSRCRFSMMMPDVGIDIELDTRDEERGGARRRWRTGAR